MGLKYEEVWGLEINKDLEEQQPGANSFKL